MVPRGLRWRRAWTHNAHRICRSNVIVRVRANEATRWRPNGVTCCGNGKEPNTEHAHIRTLSDRWREHILAECQTEIKKHECQADSDRRNARKLCEIIESQQEELHCAQVEELQRRDQQLLHEAHHNSQWNGKIKEVAVLYIRHCCKTKIGRRPGHYFGFTGKILDLQNEIDCMNDSKDFKDAESLRSGNSHVISRRTSFPPPLHQRNSSIEEPLHLSTVEKANTKSRSEIPVWTVIQKFSHLQWTRLFKKLWSRFQIFISTNSLHQLRLLAGR